MSYATRADMERLYGEDEIALVATRDSEDAPNADSISQALADAGAFIDSHLASRYTLPLPAAAPMLVRPCVDIAVYYLAQTANVYTEEIRQRYEDAVGLLKRLAKGEAQLPIDTDGDGAGEHSPSVISVTGPERQFTRQKLCEL